MKKLVMAACILLLCSCRNGQAAHPIPDLTDPSRPNYVGLVLGLTYDPTAEVEGYPDIEYKDTQSYGLAIGRKFGNIRVDLSYSEQDTKNYDYAGLVDASNNMLTINGYYTYPFQKQFGVYGMVGLGGSKFEQSTELGDYHDYAPVTKIGLGATYLLLESFEVDTGYVYIKVYNAEINDTELSYEAHAFGCMLRYLF